MYVRREEVMVAWDKHRAFRERSARRGEVIKAQPGFQVQVVLQSLGYPAKYTTLQGWESHEALNTYLGSEARRTHVQANPSPTEDLATEARPVEAYEVVFDVVSPGRQAQFTEVWDWTINRHGRGREACEQGWKELFELRREHVQGFVAGRVLRFLGNPAQYLVINDFESREAARAGLAVPQIRAFFETDPFEQNASAPAAWEAHAVVSQVGK